MLVEVLPSGLYSRCTTTENGRVATAPGRSGPSSVSRMATSMMPESAATAPPVAEGSDASAATRISGLRPRMTSRSKPGGMTTTKLAVPRRSASSPAAAPATDPRKSK